MTRALSILVLLHCLFALQANSAEFVIGPEDIDPKFDEPQWTEVQYSEIPKSSEMIVRMSSEDVKKAFWAKHSDRYDVEKTHLELREERPILSGDAYSRRMLMYLTDYRERSDHGYCGAYVAIWFAPSGTIRGFYFSERMCPI